MTRKETAKRYGLFIVSLFFSALGVALAKHSGLGVTPISSVPNIVSLKFTCLSMGTWLTVWNCLLILGQVLLLGRKFQKVQLLQVPLSFLFGAFTDAGMALVAPIPTEHYAVRLALILAGTAVLGFGIALSVIADVIMNAGEAFVKAVADRTHRDFANVKIVLDVSYVLAAVLLSLIFFGGQVLGTREGTILSAVLTGVAVKLFRRPLAAPLTRLLKEE